MSVIRSAAPTQHIEVLEPADERFVLMPKLHRIAFIEFRTLIQFGVTHA